MASDLSTVLKLEVPVIVRIGQRTMKLRDVLGISPGTIIEIPKNAEEPLDLLINNKHVGMGTAVKVGENFGLRISCIGDIKERMEAAAGPLPQPADGADSAPEAAIAGGV